MKRRLPSLVAITVLAVPALTACGGDGSEYCDRFRENAESNAFDNLGEDDVDQIQSELETFRDIAPEELQDDYDALIGVFNGESPEAAQEAVTNIQEYAVDNCDVTVE